jgi:sulfite reductase alpha subunit-like flavoprotein
LSQFYTQNRPFYQDRLGTNIGNVEIKGVLCRNLEADGRAFCEVVGLDPAQWVRLVPSAEKWRESMPTCCDAQGRTQVLELVCSHVDFQGWPRRPFFKQAALLAQKDVEAQRLE